MTKVILLVALVGLLLYFIVRRFRMVGEQIMGDNLSYRSSATEQLIVVSAKTVRHTTQKTFLTVGCGFLLLLVILVVTVKFKIALIMLPISLYLIGQFYLLRSHLKRVNDQQITFNKLNNEVSVKPVSGSLVSFNLDTDIQQIREVKSVQRNNGILFGYYELIHTQGKVCIPYLLKENPENKQFFDKVQQRAREVETKLFPIL